MNDFKTGVSFISNHRIISKVISLSFIANAVFSPALTIGLIYVASMVIKVSDFQLGILQSSLMVGSLAGALLAGIIGKKFQLAKTLYIALMIMGLFVCLIGLSSLPSYLQLFNTNLIPYLTIITLAIIIVSAAVVTNVGMSTLMQKEVPLDMMGRVSSVKETASMCATPVGQLVFGFMLDRVGSSVPIIISGVIMIIAATIFNYSINREITPMEAFKRADNLV